MTTSQDTSTHEQSPRRALRWLLTGLAGISLLVLITLSAISAALGTHSGSQWLLAQATGLVPDFRYENAEGTFLRGIDLYGVSYRSGDNLVRVEQLHSRWNPMTLMDGEFHLQSLRIAGVQVDWHSDPDAPAGPPLVLDDVLEPILPLPISVRLSNARLDGATINYDDFSYTISSLGLNVSLQGHTLNIQQLSLDAEPVTLTAELEVELQSPYALNGTVDWQLDNSLLEGTAAPNGHLSVDGDLDRLQIEHELSGLTDAESRGEVQLGLARLLNARSDSLDLQVDLEHTLGTQTLPGPGMEAFTVQALTLRTQGTPDDLGLFAAARLDIELAEDFVLETDLNLRAALRGSQLQIDELAMRTASGLLALAGDVNWSDGIAVDLNYELDEPAPGNYIPGLPESMVIQDLRSSGQVTFTQAATSASGEAGQMALAFNSDDLRATVNDYPLTGSAGFDYDGANWTVDSFALQTGENQLTLTASLNADNQINADATIDAPTLSVLYPDLEGRLRADAIVTGTLNEPAIDLDLIANNIVFGEFSIPELNMTGQNRGGMNEIELTTGNIQVPVGENTETISDVLLRLRGQPDAHNLLLRMNSSLINLRLNADGSLANGGWQGRLLSSEIDSDYGLWQQTQAAELALAADQVTLNPLCWSMGDTRVCVEAGLSEGSQLDARIDLQNYPLTALNHVQSEQNIANLTDSDFHADNNATADVRLPFTLPPDMALQGYLSLQATAAGDISDLNGLDISVQTLSENGNLYLQSEPSADDIVEGELPEPAITHFVWSNISLDATQQAREWQLSSQLRFVQNDPDSTAAAMRGSADANIRMTESRGLNGNVRLDFDDLGWVEALAPQLANVTGTLEGRLNVDGTLEQPIIGSDILLSGADFQLPALGLNMQSVEISLSSDNSERFVLNGYAESGSGSMEFNSEILQPLSEERRMTLQLAGSDFVVADLPELSAAISPDLRATASMEGIDVNGRLLIPTVDARITTLPESAVDVSSDTVIVATEEDSDVRNAAQVNRGILSDIPLSGNIQLILGDSVNISGFGLNARLTGQLDIDQRPSATPLTYGELEVADGSFEIYGRTLNIERGKLLFMGSYDNPAIDIRAVRTVENMRVGVQMNGTIRNIRSSLFSTPALPDGDILAVMITGRPIAEIGSEQEGNALVGAVTSLGINQGQGITNQIQSQLGLDTFAINSRGDVNDSSLMLGKYITPRIFIRYAVGLFETENSLEIDYTVNDRVKLQATSGQSQSIDLTYTVEQ
ncbi:translocation/assembly module TamB domain-containing protein [Pseudohongiella acticola]|jgi:translocation and assembly module TamB|uniref:translocation/assembly module TamB domain-containing protein n=1 Tax=Pseudohongiella acticola TaxID=1524254 RepID=UPI0030EFA41C